MSTEVGFQLVRTGESQSINGSSSPSTQAGKLSNGRQATYTLGNVSANPAGSIGQTTLAPSSQVGIPSATSFSAVNSLVGGSKRKQPEPESNPRTVLKLKGQSPAKKSCLRNPDSPSSPTKTVTFVPSPPAKSEEICALEEQGRKKLLELTETMNTLFSKYAEESKIVKNDLFHKQVECRNTEFKLARLQKEAAEQKEKLHLKEVGFSQREQALQKAIKQLEQEKLAFKEEKAKQQEQLEKTMQLSERNAQVGEELDRRRLELDGISQQLEVRSHEVNESSKEVASRLTKKLEEIVTFSKATKQRQQEVVAREERVAEKEKELAMREERVTEKENDLRMRGEAMAREEEKLSKLKQILAEFQSN